MSESNMDRAKLLRQIQIATFAAYETALYLDTHNTDQEALKYYAKQNKKAKELEAEYAAKYGPMHIGEVESDRVWNWSKGPWPWEYSAN